MPTHNFENRVAGDVQTDRAIPLKSGQSVAANQVLAREIATNKLVAHNSSDGAGFEVHSIAKDAIDATSGDTYGDYYVRAEQFNADNLVFENTGDTWQDVAEALRERGIYLVEFQDAESS